MLAMGTSMIRILLFVWGLAPLSGLMGLSNVQEKVPLLTVTAAAAAVSCLLSVSDASDAALHVNGVR